MNKIEKIAIFGATGMTGICVLEEAIATGFKGIKLLLREPSRLPNKYVEKVEIVKGNVTNLEDVKKVIPDVDAVIVVLGTRNNLEPTTELSTGLQNIVKVMKEHNKKVISVCLSAFLFYEPDKVPPVFNHINEEHKRMLDVLKSSDLQYIAVFPPIIADIPDKSEYTVKHGCSPGGRVISKNELANFLVTCLFKEEHYGKVVGICSVSHLPKQCCRSLEARSCFIRLDGLQCKTFSISALRRRISIHDESFSEIMKEKLKEVAKDPKLLLQGLRYIPQEFKMLLEEKNKELFFRQKPFQVDSHDGLIDMLFTFEKEEDIQQFVVFSDSTRNIGESTGSLELTQHGTALFSGYINSKVKEDGESRKVKGFAGMLSNTRVKAFGRKFTFDWTNYTHLVFKVRGDGRTYLITLPLPGSYDDHKYDHSSFPLTTRGGPYWQITKIPFSHFILTPNARIFEYQGPTPLDLITKLGIMALYNDGPFKLEIDYIGLEVDMNYRLTSPYETYYIGQ